jgi:pimeloyl-ACP methyl ester carboxylesterase
MPDLIRHPVFPWIPAFAGMTPCVIAYVVAYKRKINFLSSELKGQRMNGAQNSFQAAPAKMERRRLDIHDGRYRLPVEIIEPPARSMGGTGPMLVFLHEGLGSIAQWRDFPFAVSLAAHMPAAVYERGGYGNADPLDAPRSVRYIHEEALQSLPEVLRHLQIDDAILIGHSDGGSIALIFAAVWPEKVRGIITEAAHVFVEEVTLAGIREAVRIYTSTGLPDRLSKYHGSNTDAAFRGWSETWLSPAFRDWNIEEYLPGVRCPVLAIQGRDDEYGTSAQVEAIVNGVSGPAEPLIIADCGHVPHHQARERVLAEMTRFILTLTGRRT